MPKSMKSKREVNILEIRRFIMNLKPNEPPSFIAHLWLHLSMKSTCTNYIQLSKNGNYVEYESVRLK